CRRSSGAQRGAGCSQTTRARTRRQIQVAQSGDRRLPHATRGARDGTFGDASAKRDHSHSTIRRRCGAAALERSRGEPMIDARKATGGKAATSPLARAANAVLLVVGTLALARAVVLTEVDVGQVG